MTQCIQITEFKFHQMRAVVPNLMLAKVICYIVAVEFNVCREVY